MIAVEEQEYCCAMRRHFIIGIAGARGDEPVPFDVMEFMPDIQTKLIVIKFCPFCGVQLDNNQPVRIIEPSPDDPDGEDLF